jgi:predicted O-methyltransferase YrrM
MGIHINIAVELRSWCIKHNIGGPLLTLGVQDTPFAWGEYQHAVDDEVGFDPNAPVKASDLFSTWGFSEYLALDVSGYEGAEVLFDLNRSDLPASLLDRFGLIINGGTLEHVFHVPNALYNISRMVKTGGMIVHITPLHNWVDHGFYQFGSTLFYDYYHQCNYPVLEAACFFYDIISEATAPRKTTWRVDPAPPGTFGSGRAGSLGTNAGLLVMLVQKAADPSSSIAPIQSLYAAKPSVEPAKPTWFPPYEVRRGRPVRSARVREVQLTALENVGGLAWRANVPRLSETADTERNAVRSQLALFEDDILLGPPHSYHDLIRTAGGGSYSHWGEQIYFSTSDGTDPLHNGRKYIARMPYISGGRRAGSGMLTNIRQKQKPTAVLDSRDLLGRIHESAGAGLEGALARTLSHARRFLEPGIVTGGTSSMEDCALLYLLIGYFKPRRIFEIGTFIGTTAVAMNEAARMVGATVTTCDPVSYDAFEGDSGIRFINLPSEEALEVLQHDGPIDFCFMDWMPDIATIELANRLFSKDAIIAVHDYYPANKGHPEEKGSKIVEHLNDHYINIPLGRWHFPTDPPFITPAGTQINLCTAFFIPHNLAEKVRQAQSQQDEVA